MRKGNTDDIWIIHFWRNNEGSLQKFIWNFLLPLWEKVPSKIAFHTEHIPTKMRGRNSWKLFIVPNNFQCWQMSNSVQFFRWLFTIQNLMLNGVGLPMISIKVHAIDSAINVQSWWLCIDWTDVKYEWGMSSLKRLWHGKAVIAFSYMPNKVMGPE